MHLYTHACTHGRTQARVYDPMVTNARVHACTDATPAATGSRAMISNANCRGGNATSTVVVVCGPSPRSAWCESLRRSVGAEGPPLATTRLEMSPRGGASALMRETEVKARSSMPIRTRCRRCARSCGAGYLSQYITRCGMASGFFMPSHDIYVSCL